MHTTSDNFDSRLHAAARGESSAPPASSPWLHRLAMLTAIATFPLIFMGGLVTSNHAGMSVPDWPNSYGYNMFLFPPSHWVGGILYEHTHRLMATIVGMLSIALVIWAWRGQIFSIGVKLFHLITPRTSDLPAPATQMAPEPHRYLALAVLLTVIFQGVLGGLRVVLVKLDLAIVHACVAQAFFCLTAYMALVTSTWWENAGKEFSTEKNSGFPRNAAPDRSRYRSAGRQIAALDDARFGSADGVTTAPDNLRFQGALPGNAANPQAVLARSFVDANGSDARDGRSRQSLTGLFILGIATVCVIYLQLMVGATMRHFDAGLAIPDLPLAYGKLLPPTTAAGLAAVNHLRAFELNLDPVTLGQIWLHFAHRVGAVIVSVLVISLSFTAICRRDVRGIALPAGILLLLLAAQITLGVLTVALRKPADIASAHVAVGALVLMTSFVLTAFLGRLRQRARVVAKDVENDVPGLAGLAPA